jgi:hypothetical protein
MSLVYVAALFLQGGMKGDQGALVTVAAQGGAPAATVSVRGRALGTVAALGGAHHLPRGDLGAPPLMAAGALHQGRAAGAR